MAAGPTKEQVARRSHEVVQKLGRDLAKATGYPFRYERGGYGFVKLPVGTIQIEAKVIRASNGEAAVWATAGSPKGSLNGPPWASDGNQCTVENVIAKLV